MTYIVLLMIIYSSIACKETTTKRNISDSKFKVVYIEAKTKAGTETDKFGDVVMYDLEAKEKTYITDDEYYDKEPVWSPDGKEILFQTNRKGNDVDLTIKGVRGPHQVYIINLESMVMKEINIRYQLNRAKQMRTQIENLDWLDSGLGYIFTLNRKNIYRFSSNDDSISFVKNIDNFKGLKNVLFSTKQNICAIDYETKDFFKRGLAIINFDFTGIEKKIDLKKYVRIQDWLPEELKILYRGKKSVLNEYSFNTKEDKILFSKADSLGIYIAECKYLDENRLVCLASKRAKKIIEGKEKEITLNNEIAILDLAKNKIEWLTNDGLDKKYLDVFIKK